MSLSDDLTSARSLAEAEFAAALTAQAVEDVRVAILGRNGRLKELQKHFAAAPSEDKRVLGPLFNAFKEAVEAAFTQAQSRVAGAASEAAIDLSLPSVPRHTGSIHPLSQLAQEIELVFTGMGYEVVDGPHIEFDEFNFTRLNIPPDHPARDHQDTFWLEAGSWPERKLLRTHTSSVQSRTYLAMQPPLRKVVVGRVFRYEAVDATHDNTFTQVEGFVIDRDITVAHLVGTLRTMLSAALQRTDIEVRLRPSYFPFVEPGFEVDVRYTTAEAGSRFASWVELLGCGMIHPRVLEQGGIDPTQWQGFAFGLGLERLAMIRHDIQDIRMFNGAYVRALRQFGW